MNDYLFSRGFAFGGIQHIGLFLAVALFRYRESFRSFPNSSELRVVIIRRGLKRRFPITHFIVGEN